MSTWWSKASTPSAPTHPYYPQFLALNNYVPNTRSTAELAGAWISALCLVTMGTFAWLRAKKLTLAERLTTLWFITCGSIHLVFEGHFVVHNKALPSLVDFISQEWKEYAKSDSRYLYSDPFILTIETITASVWGPLCFYIAFATANRYPSRHVWTALMCFAHIYGSALYYGTTLAKGSSDSRPEFLYFWVYFIGLNGLWLITPIALLTKSIVSINKAMVKAGEDKVGKKKM